MTGLRQQVCALFERNDDDLNGGKKMKEELLKGLTEEQIEKAKACKSSDEILQLAKAEGIELTDEQLEAVSGGCDSGDGNKCPKCGHKMYAMKNQDCYSVVCTKCGYTK